MGDKNGAIIVASGLGKRFGSQLPKQFHKIFSLPVWYYSVKSFAESKMINDIVIVAHPGYVEEVEQSANAHFKNLVKTHIVPGGVERYNSVYNGLIFFRDNLGYAANSIIAVHDAVRCLISSDLVVKNIDDAQKYGSSIVYTDSEDTLKYREGSKVSIIDRNKVMRIQTPQSACLLQLIESFEHGFSTNFNGTDESSFLEHNNIVVHYTEGEKSNIKITKPEDILFAEIYLKLKGALV